MKTYMAETSTVVDDTWCVYLLPDPKLPRGDDNDPVLVAQFHGDCAKSHAQGFAIALNKAERAKKKGPDRE